MSPKELLYMEDALSHEQMMQKKCADLSAKLQDQELKSFVIENSDIKIILCQFKIHELEAIREELLSLPNLYTDTSSLRVNLFGKASTDIFRKAVFGSGYPLLHVAPSALMLTELEGEEREIFYSRADVL